MSPREPLLRVVIVDDEPLARESIRILLKPHEDISVVGECNDGREALEAIRRHRPDIVFLDIQMPALDGFDVIEALGDETPVIVFVSAYDRYAMRAFDVHAADYLLKPFTDARFEDALSNAIERLRGGSPQTRSNVAAIADEPRAYTRRFMVSVRGAIRFLKAEAVDWIEAADYYSRLHVGPSSYLIRLPMNDLEATLDPDAFVRVHRSAIVNVDRVVEMRPTFRNELIVVLENGTEVRMSRARRHALEERFRVRRG